MLIPWQNLFFIIYEIAEHAPKICYFAPTVYFSSLAVDVFYLSLTCHIIARLFPISWMLGTSLLHVILVVCTHYFSRIYQSSLFLFTDSFPTRVSIPFISTQSLLLARLSFICTPLESIPQMYIRHPPFYSLLSLCFACCLLFYLFCGLDQRT
jgi:hypothetical protein